MIAINPLTSKELENASKEYFAKEFVSSRLGTLGHWLGSGAEKLMLENPVTLPQFQNLARGLPPPRVNAEPTLPKTMSASKSKSVTVVGKPRGGCRVSSNAPDTDSPNRVQPLGRE